MKKHTEPLCCETFYHIYNRGVNGEDLFREERNYTYFLEKYAKYIPPVADTYAYCLLKNHFHLLVRVRSATEIVRNVKKRKENVSWARNPNDIEITASRLAGHQFAIFFNGYSQAINKANGRTGSLFEESFRRIPVESESYCCWVARYIHRNAQKHSFVDDFRDYPHSSFHTFLSQSPTKIKREEVLSWFGNVDIFKQFHEDREPPKGAEKYEIELD